MKLIQLGSPRHKQTVQKREYSIADQAFLTMQPTKPRTSNHTKCHEGFGLTTLPSCTFVAFVVNGFGNRPAREIQAPARAVIPARMWVIRVSMYVQISQFVTKVLIRQRFRRLVRRKELTNLET